MSIERFDVAARLSDMAVYNGVAYLAGQIPESPNLDIGGQTQEVLAAIDGLLARAGTDKSKILMATIYLADIADFAGMNLVWDAWIGDQIGAGNAPPRATVEAKLARPHWKIEIVVTAAVPAKSTI
jgi:enamine deaminase RidA (YjgF/YER057c/UK114 family)